MDKKIYEDVRRVINEVMEKESPDLSRKRSATLDKTASFMESLEVDSLLALEMVSKIEKKFGVQLKEEDFMHFDTLENIASFIERRMKEKGSPKTKPPKKNIVKSKKMPRKNKSR